MTQLIGNIENIQDNNVLDMPVFTTDWFSSNINRWNNYKSLFHNKENIHCLEIGSWQGRSTIYTAENYCNGKGSYVDAVDTWEGSVEHSDLTKNNLFEIFKANTHKYVEEKRIIPYRGMSSDYLMKFVQEVRNGTREQYDFIYVDASHIAKDVLMDAVLSWEILKINGVMIFDDYEWEEYKEASMTPKIAVDSVLQVYQGMYEIIYKGYQVHIKKTKDSPI